ncbi:MAG TPA: AAA family ATPase [Nitrososphaerales archaeon]|nr:AAA family ATPase [Nitrososphaerales archaeon]
MRKVVGVTGTPATGKRSTAPILAKLLATTSLSLNDLALQGRRKRPRTLQVDMAVLKGRLEGARPQPGIIYGHLLPYVLRRSDVTKVFVLRCDPSELKRRLVARGYSRTKVRENVEAELIGVLSSDSVAKFGADRVVELDSTSATPETLARTMFRFVRRSPSKRWIDWTVAYASVEKLTSLLGA